MGFYSKDLILRSSYSFFSINGKVSIIGYFNTHFLRSWLNILLRNKSVSFVSEKSKTFYKGLETSKILEISQTVLDDYSVLKVKSICDIYQKMRMSRRWKYVYVDTIWGKTTSTRHCHQWVNSTRVLSASLRVPFRATCMHTQAWYALIPITSLRTRQCKPVKCKR